MRVRRTCEGLGGGPSVDDHRDLPHAAGRGVPAAADARAATRSTAPTSPARRRCRCSRNDHIEDFRATSSHLVVSVRADDEAQLHRHRPRRGRPSATLPLPGDGLRLQPAERRSRRAHRLHVLGCRSRATPGGLESALFTASLKESEADAEPTAVDVTGAEPRVAEWRFVPDTDSILLLSFDGSLLLTGSAGQDATALGSAIAIDGIARGSSEAIVERLDGMVVHRPHRRERGPARRRRRRPRVGSAR